MQRRRRAKAEPKNIFGSSATAKSSTTSKEKMKAKSVKKIAKPLPPSIPGTIPKLSNSNSIKTKLTDNIVVKNDNTEKKLEEDVEEIIEENNIETIIEKQIIPDKRMSIGLSKKIEEEKIEIVIPENEIKHSSKAKEIIDKSTARANEKNQIHKVTVKKSVKEAPIKDEKIVKPRNKINKSISSYQPANRARRLDRSRHMEYKYEMRRTMEDIDVLDEYRSNILATVWARGERQTTKEAHDFLMDKLSDGIIDENQMTTLKKIVEGYTIRR